MTEDPVDDANDPAAPQDVERPAADAESAPDACDWDITDPSSLQATWLAFQRDRGASCPVTGTEFELALAHDPAEGEGNAAEVLVSCGLCGRQVAFAPPDAREVFGWAE